MSRDYAKRVYRGSQKKRVNQKWLVLAAIIVFFVGSVGLWVKFHSGAVFSEKHDTSTFLSRLKAKFVKQPPVISSNTVKKEQDIAKPDVQFSFYDQLPHMRVEVSPVEQPKTKISNKINEVKTSKTEKENASAASPSYFLQFGLFKEVAGASQLRFSLLLAGIETEIEKIETGQEKTYRVWQGAFSTLSEAKLYQEKWRKKGIESVVKQED